MLPHLLDVSNKLDVDVFAYDYLGYGCSGGPDALPSVRAVLQNIEVVYEYLVNDLRVHPDRIIAYGQSLGSGPSVHIASKHRIAGVVLHSPLASGLRVIRPIETSVWFDIFANIDLMTKIDVPVFIIHGMEDKDIPVTHGQLLYENSSKQFQP
jgi:pimeloyl-ACP methyl ester carboxylesterase